MQILINCCNISLGHHMNVYLKNEFNKNPTLIHDNCPLLDNELQLSVYTSEIETCLERMVNRTKELCSILDFTQHKTREAIFNDMMGYMQSINMWNWCLKMVYEKYPNNGNIELFFTNIIRNGGDYFTRQHVEHARQKTKVHINPTHMSATKVK